MEKESVDTVKSSDNKNIPSSVAIDKSGQSIFWWHPKLMDYRIPFFKELSSTHNIKFFLSHESAFDNEFITIPASGKSSRRPSSWQDLKQLAANIKQCDIFVTSFLWNGFSAVGIILSFLYGKKVIVWEEEWFMFPGLKHQLKRLVMKILAKFTHSFFVLGDVQKEFLGNIGVASCQVFVANEYPGFIYDEIPVEVIDLPVSEDKQVLLCIGRLVEYKGVEYLLRSMKTIKAKMPNTELIIVGDGPLRNQLEQLTRELGISDVIHFLGWVSDPRQKSFLYRRCSVVVVPSTTMARGESEGGPLTVLEALSASKPVVGTTALASSTKFIENSVNGYVVEQRNSEALAQSIMDALRNEEQLSVGAQQSFKKIKGHEHQAAIFNSALQFAIKQ